MLRIMLVDDHPAIGEGTKMMLEKEEMDVTVVHSGDQAIQIINTETYDLYLIDLSMPEMDGIQLTKKIRSIHPDAIILIFTGYELTNYYHVLINAGASGFVSKTASKEELINAINYALRGEAIVPISLLQQLHRNNMVVVDHEHDAEQRIIHLTAKEREVLFEVAKGKRNREISENLLVSQRAVEQHLTNLFMKLNVQSRIEAVVEAKRLGLLLDEDVTK